MNDYRTTKRLTSRIWLLVVTAAWTSLCGTATSQVTQTDTITLDDIPGTRYTITAPAKSPVAPWMKISLLPPPHELQSGNAAPLYYRAILSASQAQNNLENRRKSQSESSDEENSPRFWDQHQTWMETPMSELPIEDVEQGLRPFRRALEEAGFAARRSYCEWDFPVREAKTDIFNVLLDEIQECRMLARLIGLRVRLRLAQGRIEEAVADLQSGYALARNVGSRGFIVNHLVGEAIAEQMHELTLELLTQDDSPNLYWTISALPNPLIDARVSSQQEMMTLRIIFPEMFEALESNAVLNDAYWDDQLRALISRWVDIDPPKYGNPGSTERLLQELAWQAMAYSQAPRVKQEMVAELGYSQAEVDAMPDARALLAHGAIRSQEIQDAYFAPLSLPYYEAERFYQQQYDAPPSTPIFTPQLAAETWLAPLQQHHLYLARSQDWYQMMQIVESLRDYAHRHGQLPEKLDQLTELPINPISPITGKPFDYLREASDANVATLTGGLPYFKSQLEIHIRP